MPQVRETEQGTFVQQPNGRWRLAAPAEIEAINESGVSAAGRSLGLNLAAGMQFLTLGGPPSAVQGPGNRLDVFNQNLERLGQTGQKLNLLEQFSPTAEAVGFQGALIADPLNLLGGIPKTAAQTARGAVQRTTRRMVGDAATEPGPAPGSFPVAPVATAAREGGDIIEQVAAREASAGAAEVQARGGIPGFFDQIFTTGRPLTAQQQALIETGEEVGFKFLPGQVSGNRVFLEALQSNPVGREMFAFELDSNSKLIERTVVEMLDLPPETELTRGILGDARRTVGARFEDVRAKIGDLDSTLTMDPDDVAFLAEPEIRSVLTMRQRRINLDQMTPNQYMEIRSRLDERATQFFRNGENQAGRDISDVIQRMDESLDDALLAAGDDTTRAEWQKAKQEWRVFLALRAPGSITPEGEVSLKVLTRNMEKVFEREFGQELLPSAAFREANPAIAKGMDVLRVARSFASNLPDSGTPTRTAVIEMLRNPKRAFDTVATAKILRKLLDVSTPE